MKELANILRNRFRCVFTKTFYAIKIVVKIYIKMYIGKIYIGLDPEIEIIKKFKIGCPIKLHRSEIVLPQTSAILVE